MRHHLAILILLVSAALWATTQKPTPAPADSDKPQPVRIINGPTVEHAGNAEAIVAWSTNVNAGSVVKYGTDPNKLDKKAEMPWGGLTHRVTLRGLQPNTTYYFQVESAQGQGTGTSATSNIAEIKTTVAKTAAPPPSSIQIQAGPIAQNVTDKTAIIWWETNRSSEAILKYGTDPNRLDHVAEKASGDQSHRVELSNLQPGTEYYVAVAEPNGAARATAHFKTALADFARSNKVRITNGPVIEYLSDNSAVIAWSTNQRSSSIVRYGADPNSLAQVGEAPWSQGTHRVNLKDLKPNTRYYFVVESSQAQGAGVMAKSEPAPFQTVNSGQAALRISMEK